MFVFSRISEIKLSLEMHNRINPDIDIIADILQTVLKAKPDDLFCKSLQLQYAERGGLSKKQLEGLLGKAQKLPEAKPGKLATLEAIIKKKHITHRSTVTIQNALPQKDEALGVLIDAILQKYPMHKRVLLFKSKFDKDGNLSPAEKEETERFFRLLANK